MRAAERGTASDRRHADRIGGVDLMRGLAILFVLMNHVNMRLLGAGMHYLAGVPPQLASTLVWNGQYGVQMFFAISGFLITSMSMRRWGAPGDLRAGQFYRLRFARIAPLLLALLLVLAGLHLAGVPDYVVRDKQGGLPAALFAALTLHINWLEATRGYLPGNWDVLWSLSVEEAFYVAFPLVALTLRRTRLLALLSFAFVLAGPFARLKAFDPNPVWREYSYLGSKDANALGCLTAMLLSHLRPSPASARLLSRACATLGCACLLLVLGFSNLLATWHLYATGLDMTVVAVGTCLVIVACTQSGWAVPAALRPLATVGRHSYEIYLTHMFVVYTLFDAFQQAGEPVVWIPALFAATLLLSALLGAVVARLFSEPLNRRLRGSAA